GLPSFSTEHDDTPLRKIDVEMPVGLRPGLVKGITGAVPAAKCRVLRAQNLRPLAVVAPGPDAVAVIGEILLAEIHDDQYDVVIELPEEAKHLICVILMRDGQRVGSQRGVLPTDGIARGDEPAHLHANRIAGDAPVE